MEKDAPESEEKPNDAAEGAQQAAQSGEKPDGGKESAEEEKPTEEPAEPVSDKSAQNGEDTADGSDTAQLKADLLDARSKLAAYEAGVSPDMIADAVTLATAEARAAGEVTDEAVSKAMANVLKRHPEWKASGADKKKAGGFRLGADPDSRGSGRAGKEADSGRKKPWNKFNR